MPPLFVPTLCCAPKVLAAAETAVENIDPEDAEEFVRISVAAAEAAFAAQEAHRTAVKAAGAAAVTAREDAAAAVAADVAARRPGKGFGVLPPPPRRAAAPAASPPPPPGGAKAAGAEQEEGGAESLDDQVDAALDANAVRRAALVARCSRLRADEPNRPLVSAPKNLLVRLRSSMRRVIRECFCASCLKAGMTAAPSSRGDLKRKLHLPKQLSKRISIAIHRCLGLLGRYTRGRAVRRVGGCLAGDDRDRGRPGCRRAK